MLSGGREKVHSVGVEVGMITEVARKGEHSRLLVLGLLLDQSGDGSLGRGIPDWGGTRSSGGQVELDIRISLTDSTKMKERTTF
jgi:hypothetical protein